MSSDNRYDLIVIGGGIVGLATSCQLLIRKPGLRLCLLEKERELGTHQTGHNSGVLHAGLYYPPGSRKALLCREGKRDLQIFADEHGIPYELCGKLVVALDQGELDRLANIKQRATANGVEGLEEVGPERIRELEPHAAGIRALWSPGSGIIDFRRVALAYADEVRSRGGTILNGEEVRSISSGAEQVVITRTRELVARDLIGCAGLYADRVAAMTGDAGDERVVPFRGDYYTLKPEARRLVRALIYPVPDPRFPFLGVHFTKRIDGEVLAGPNAVLAFAREGYKRLHIAPRELAATLLFPGFRRLARSYFRTGLAEMWRDWSKTAFTAQLMRYVPEITAHDLIFGPSGVRAQSLAADGRMVDDFSISDGPHVLHVRNAPSPAATASLAIGRDLAEMAIARFAI
ncbi:MAG TPA: L-2-hydroxyglutarate oxidase [Thermoanaerobaculia bacterium]|nr:L-2-hydroxyglutarate oxidase [Thermoanaerobaculia bacterium]